MQEQLRTVKPFSPALECLQLGVGGQRLIAAVARADRGLPNQRGPFGVRAKPGEHPGPQRLPGVLGRVTAGDEVAELGGGHERVCPRKLEQNRRRVFGQSEHRVVETRHARRHDVRRVGLRRHEVQPVDRQDPEPIERRAEEVRIHDGPLAPRGLGGADLHARQGGGVFDVEAQILARGRLQHVRLDTVAAAG